MGHSPRSPFQRVITAVVGERITATFLVTSPAHTRVRAALYASGASFLDDRVATFDWTFRVSARRRDWDRFVAICREQLQQLEIMPA